MKQTNNAIKFLMAQYRAIFQNAYFKGLATAAVVTMGLAAGQAQAAPNTAFDGTQAITGDIITITGDATTDPATTPDNYTKIAVTAKNQDNQDKAIVINSGTTTANNITGTAEATFTAKSLTINSTGDTDQGLKINGSTANTTADFTDFVTLTKGTIHLVGGDNAGTLQSKKIDIGTKAEAQPKDVEPNAILTLDKGGVLGKALAGGELNTLGIINLNNDGKIHAVSGSSGKVTSTINAGQFNINGGTLSIDSDDAGTSGNAVTLTLAKGKMDGGTIAIKSGGSLTIAFTTEDITENTKTLEKSFAFNSGSIDAKGDITLTGKGVVTLANPDQLTINADSGKEANFVVSGADAQHATTLSLSKAALDNLAAKTKIDTKNAVLDITGNDEIKLGKAGNLTFAKTSAAKDQILAGANTTLKAQTVKVDGEVTNGTTLTVQADTLTLAGASSKLAGLGAKNVTFEQTGTDPYKLEEDLTLSSTQKDAKGNDVATSGTLAGNVLISGATVALNGGIYSSSSDITLDAGTLNVGDGSDPNAATSLTLSSLAITNENGDNTITIAGKENKEAVLNIVAADLEGNLTGHASKKTEITVNEFGTLELTGDQLAQLINKDNAWRNTNGAGILIDKGTVDTLDTSIDTELSVDDLASGASVIANKITFHETNGGTLNTQSLSLKDNNTPDGLDIGPGTIDVGGSLTLTAKDASGDFVVKTGNLVLGNEVKSGNNAKLVIGESGSSAAKLDLGSVWVENEAVQHSADAGQVRVDLALAGKDGSNKSELNVKYGQWSAKEITAEFADIKIGYDVSNEATAIQKLNHNWV